ncbi:MAG: hypothetical protein JJU10_07580 [Idiomarina sp.]|nr:hypothetical protein [Idiomarina sp.]
MKKSPLTLACALALGSAMIATAPAHADIQWSGFANVGGGFVTNSGETLFGYDDTFGFNPDTLFALQGTKSISDRLSATVQLMSRAEDGYNLELAWAYLQYTLSDSLTLNAGQLRMPFYQYSDSLDVAYSYHWLRTPPSVYRVAFDSYTGASLTHNAFVGGGALSTQFIFGRYDDTISFGGQDTDTDIQNLLGANVTWYFDHLTLRAGYFISDSVTIQVGDPAFQGLLATLEGAGLASVADNIRVEDDRGSFAGVGVMYDNFDWFIGGEYTELEVDNSFIASQRSQYITAGKRFGAITVHGTLEQTRDQAASPQSGIPAGFPPELFLGVEGLVESQVSRVNYTSLGLRYDITAGVALKFDVTKADNKRTNTDATLVSFAIQTVF